MSGFTFLISSLNVHFGFRTQSAVFTLIVTAHKITTNEIIEKRAILAYA